MARGRCAPWNNNIILVSFPDPTLVGSGNETTTKGYLIASHTLQSLILKGVACETKRSLRRYWLMRQAASVRMTCRIVLCGANSVGKTTLAEDWVKKHPEYFYLEEVARKVMPENSITSKDVRESLKTPDKSTLVKLQNLIIEEQNKQELALGDRRYVISDRGPDPLAFLCQLKDEQAADDLSQLPSAVACLERYRTNFLVVVVGSLKTIPEDDGFRMVQDDQEGKEFTEILCRMLVKHKIPYSYLAETDREKRVFELEKLVAEKVK